MSPTQRTDQALPADAASFAAGAETEAPELAAIWAQARHRVIGSEGTMPWHVPADFRFFKEQTLGFPVVMGRRTWESFPERFRPLPGRTNIVLSRSAEPGENQGAVWTADLDSALRTAARAPGGDQRIWILGGASLYAAALAAQDLPVARGGAVTRCLVTELDLDVPGTALAPELGPDWSVRELGAGVEEKARALEPDADGNRALVPHPVPYRFLEYTR